MPAIPLALSFAVTVLGAGLMAGGVRAVAASRRPGQRWSSIGGPGGPGIGDGSGGGPGGSGVGVGGIGSGAGGVGITALLMR